jgi:hypothetical protein
MRGLVPGIRDFYLNEDAQGPEKSGRDANEGT